LYLSKFLQLIITFRNSLLVCALPDSSITLIGLVMVRILRGRLRMSKKSGLTLSKIWAEALLICRRIAITIKIVFRQHPQALPISDQNQWALMFQAC